MSTHDQHPGDLSGSETHAAPDPVPVAGRSLVDRIRERHAHANPHIDLSIPRWGGDIVARMDRIPARALKQVGHRRSTPLTANAGLLAAACREILIRDEHGDLHPASEADGQPGTVRFDGRLADMFGLGDAGSPGEIVLRMYGDNVAVHAHAKKVYDWQTGADLDEMPDEDVDDEVDRLGEAPAAT